MEDYLIENNQIWFQVEKIINQKTQNKKIEKDLVMR